MEMKIDDLWFCDDCYIISETGDESGLDFSFNSSEYETPEAQASAIWEGVKRLQTEYKGSIVSNNDSETGEGIDEFSWSSCDCCGTGLGGRRHRMAIIG